MVNAQKVLQGIKTAFTLVKYPTVTLVITGHAKQSNGAFACQDGQYLTLDQCLAQVPQDGVLTIIVDTCYA